MLCFRTSSLNFYIAWEVVSHGDVAGHAFGYCNFLQNSLLKPMKLSCDIMEFVRINKVSECDGDAKIQWHYKPQVYPK